MKSEMTLDKLAAMTQRGFDEMKRYTDKRFDDVDKRFEDVNKRFDEVDRQFVELEVKIETYTHFWHRKFSEHEVWLQNLDRTVANLERRFNVKPKKQNPE
jgi:K+/H+ antiporter YhaU regulatory subunit KhtT